MSSVTHLHRNNAFLPVPLHWYKQRTKIDSSRLRLFFVSRCSLDPSVAFVLSHFEADHILKLKKTAQQNPTTVRGPFSIDLGKRSLSKLLVSSEGIAVHSRSGEDKSPPLVATWAELKKMSKKGKSGAYECFIDGVSAPNKIAGISETTQRAASLYPCAPGKPPTMILGGFGMHRLKGTDPSADTKEKIRAVGKICFRGKVLDICTGLGYTAIAASEVRSVDAVTTIELDPVVVSIQRRNPWSEDLFLNPKINRIEGDAAVVLKSLPDNYYDVIVHDPPAQAMGGELYSQEFYVQLNRVSVLNATLFHYVGDPSSQESGRLYRGIMSRLQEAGFMDIKKDYGAYGIIARAR